MNKDLFKLLENIPLFSQTTRSLKNGDSSFFIPANNAFLSLFFGYLIEHDYFPVFLTDKEILRENIYDSLHSIYGEDRISYLIKKPDPLSNNSEFGRYLNQFHHLLSSFLNSKVSALCASPEILSMAMPDKEVIKRSRFVLKPGESYEFDWIISLFDSNNYKRGELCEHNGQYCVRGGIIDVYPFGKTYPLRLEFFGNTIESIRRFNPSSQLSNEEVASFKFIPNINDDSNNFLSFLPKNTLLISDSKNNNAGGFPFFFCDTEFNSDFFNTWEQKKATGGFDQLKEHLSNYSNVHLFYDHESLVENLKKEYAQENNLTFHNHIIHESLLFKDKNAAFINYDQLFHVEHMVNPDKHFIPEYAEIVDAPNSLKYGDIVIHSDYGIGRYLGIETLETNRILQDAFVIEFKNNDKVYVALKYISKIYKYSSSDNYDPKLANLRRSTTWEGTKRSVKKSIKEIAEDLLRLYGERHNAVGFSFQSNNDIIAEIEKSFPHNETPDQKKVIAEIFQDMENNKIMDRLVCGDVGFGKTEVAIRAAFKAILSNKQVAILVPTTILSIQHYESFSSRLNTFGIKVDIVNRFRKQSELQLLYKNLADGHLDILIGTHKMLSPKTIFKDLGLLIIDEEHRFGVRDKEKIKQMRKNVDVMTMTATPIPRTLEFSLMGLRDISKIETPPRERIPILTKLMFWAPDKISEALNRELLRNGQSIIVSNDVKSLDSIKSRIQKLVPSARIEYAHGQMKGDELEKRLIGFYHHKYDILIATTIIESGIDIPNANTLVVFDAHKFGLSQLYQIRGRVGRSHRRAYAYLIIPKHKHLSASAEKRLRTLEYYTDLGSGYHIAMRDLEIRGSGNLFGTVQSGFLNNVGYEYYLELLNEEIEKIKTGINNDDKVEYIADINLNMNAYIPDSYIANTNQKLDQYRMLSKCKNTKDINRIESNLQDRYGNLPKEVSLLFTEKKLSLALAPFQSTKLLVTEKEIIIYFPKNENNKALQKSASDLSQLCQEKNIEIYFSTRKVLSARLPLKTSPPLDLLLKMFPEIDKQNKINRNSLN